MIDRRQHHLEQAAAIAFSMLMCRLGVRWKP